jgi:hypothetical protein
MDRRTFFRRTGGAVAAAAVTPWITSAPAVAPAAAPEPLGTVRATSQGYHYVLVEAAKPIRVGDLIGYDETYMAAPLDKAHRGRVGYSTLDVLPTNRTWALVYSPDPVAVKVVDSNNASATIAYPWSDGQEWSIHGIRVV